MNLPDNVRDFMNYIESKGFKCYLVGGAVRDLLTGKAPKDYDFTTDGKPDEIKGIFEKYLETGIDFGTITVCHRGAWYEITTFRLEHRYSDGRRPDMVFYSDSLLSDLSRRDFTMNAIALDKNMNVYDYYNGLEDLKNGLLRTIGRAKVRFREDRLRKLRGVRIACENNYLIHQEIVKSILAEPELKGVSGERIRTELDRILLSPGAKRGVELLFRLTLMEQILPELLERVSPDEGVWEDYMDLMQRAPCELSLRVYLLLRPLALEGSTDLVLERLKYSRKIAQNVKVLARYEAMTGTEEFALHLHEFSREMLLLFQQLDQVLGRFPAWEELLQQGIEGVIPRKITDLAIGGNDLKELGYKGRKIGEVLHRLHMEVIFEPDNNTKEWLLKRTKELEE